MGGGLLTADVDDEYEKFQWINWCQVMNTEKFNAWMDEWVGRWIDGWKECRFKDCLQQSKRFKMNSHHYWMRWDGCQSDLMDFLFQNILRGYQVTKNV